MRTTSGGPAGAGRPVTTAPASVTSASGQAALGIKASQATTVESRIMSTAPTSPTLVPARDVIAAAYTWDLTAIFTSWDAWDAGAAELDRRIDAYRQFEGTLARGPQRL